MCTYNCRIQTTFNKTPLSGFRQIKWNLKSISNKHWEKRLDEFLVMSGKTSESVQKIKSVIIHLPHFLKLIHAISHGCCNLSTETAFRSANPHPPITHSEVARNWPIRSNKSSTQRAAVSLWRCIRKITNVANNNILPDTHHRGTGNNWYKDSNKSSNQVINTWTQSCGIVSSQVNFIGHSCSK